MPASSSQHPGGMSDDELNAYWDAAMRIPDTHNYASPRGRFPALRGYMRPWRRLVRSWAARAYSAAICGGETKRWEDAR